MNQFLKNIIRFFAVLLVCTAAFAQNADTTYKGIAPQNVLSMLKGGKAPRVTLQLSFNYDIGLMDLASNDNTSFHRDDFINGRDFGTRYGYGVSLTGKIALHKAGNVRLNVTAAYNRFMSNFVISESPEGKVSYSVLSGGLGLENCFNADRPFKPYVGFDIVASIISGKATYKTDSTDFNLTIKNSVRFGVGANFGFEYALNNNVGVNVGIKFVYVNAIGRETKVSANPNETYLNDNKYTGDFIPFGGWKQFFYSTLHTGINYYFGMKNRK
jgi:hypothetical protein